jgi:hypothetical protein
MYIQLGDQQTDSLIMLFVDNAAFQAIAPLGLMHHQPLTYTTHYIEIERSIKNKIALQLIISK